MNFFFSRSRQIKELQTDRLSMSTPLHKVKGEGEWAKEKARLYAKYDIPSLGPDSISALEGCPQAKAPSDKEAKDNLSQYLSAAGIKSCSTRDVTTDSEFHASATGVYVPFGGVHMSVNGESHTSDKASDGCEQVVANSMSYYDASQNLACVLNNTIQQSQQNGDMAQKVKIGINGDVKGSQINVSQDMAMDLALVANLNAEQKTQIAKDIQKVVKQRAEMIQKSTSKDGAPTQGSKAMTGFTDTNNSTDISTNITNTMNQMVQRASGTQDYELNINGDLNNSAINANQKSMVSMMAQSILGTVTSTSMSSINKHLADSDSKLLQDNQASHEPRKSSGSSSFTMILLGFGALVCLYFYFTAPPSPPAGPVAVGPAYPGAPGPQNGPWYPPQAPVSVGPEYPKPPGEQNGQQGGLVQVGPAYPQAGAPQIINRTDPNAAATTQFWANKMQQAPQKWIEAYRPEASSRHFGPARRSR